MVRTRLGDVSPDGPGGRRDPLPRASLVRVQQPAARAAGARHAAAPGAHQRRDGRPRRRGAADGRVRRRELHRRLVHRPPHRAAARQPHGDGAAVGGARRARRQLLPAAVLSGGDRRAARGGDCGAARRPGRTRGLGGAGRGRHLVPRDARRGAEDAARGEPGPPRDGAAHLHPRAPRELPVVRHRAARHLRGAGGRPRPPVHRPPVDDQALGRSRDGRRTGRSRAGARSSGSTPSATA